MAKFHISPTTGRPNKCSASVSSCPFGGDDEHYGTKEEARAAYEAQMSENNFPKAAKKPVANLEAKEKELAKAQRNVIYALEELMSQEGKNVDASKLEADYNAAVELRDKLQREVVGLTLESANITSQPTPGEQKKKDLAAAKAIEAHLQREGDKIRKDLDRQTAVASSTKSLLDNLSFVSFPSDTERKREEERLASIHAGAEEKIQELNQAANDNKKKRSEASREVRNLSPAPKPASRATTSGSAYSTKGFRSGKY